MQPSSLGHHLATSVGKRDVPKCSYSPPQPFFFALSHPEGWAAPPFYRERYELWGKWAVCPSKKSLHSQIQPLPTCLWREPRVIYHHHRQECMHVWMSTRKNLTCSHALHITGGPVAETRKSKDWRVGLYIQCIGFKGARPSRVDVKWDAKLKIIDLELWEKREQLKHENWYNSHWGYQI